MSTKTFQPVATEGPAHSKSGTSLFSPAWQPEGPTLRFKGLLRVTQVGKSKAYELIRSDNSFPKGIPLYDGRNSPKFYWTHEALAWVESRAAKFRGNEGN